MMTVCSLQRGIVNEDSNVVKIHGEKFLVMKTDTLEGRLPFNITHCQYKKGKLIPDIFYTPKQVRINYGLKDQLVDEVEFNGENPHSTIPQMAINERTFTEVFNSRGVRKVNIFGEDYFYPYVSFEEEKEVGKLYFYLIPVKGHSRKATKYGNLIIRNENKIYRPIKPKEDIYNKRYPLNWK